MMDAKRAPQEGQFGKKSRNTIGRIPKRERCQRRGEETQRYLVKRRDLAHSVGQIPY